MKTLHRFTPEYLGQCRKMTTEQILKYLDDFRKVHGAKRDDPTELISVRIPKSLLEAFKTRSKLERVCYQAQIKLLMRAWLLGKR